jgi:uncharacterized protein (TIGR03089 family)
MHVQPRRDKSGIEHDRPVIVYIDDVTGERTALSSRDVSAWTNRTANLLTRVCGRPGLAAALLPPHWRTAVILLGAWSAGFSVEYHGVGTAGLPRVGAGAATPIDVAFATGSQVIYAPAAPMRFLVRLGDEDYSLPDGYRDYGAEAANESDDFHFADGRRRSDAASPDGTSYHEWGSLARELAAMSALEPGDRVLVDAEKHEHPVRWLLAPLSVGGSIVLCANLDQSRLAERIESEAVTRVL